MQLHQAMSAPKRDDGYIQSRLDYERSAIPSLTGLRFIAALMVLISHSVTFMLPLGSPLPPWQQSLRALAFVGMPLFFVLSGFVIHYNYSQPIRSNGLRGTFNFFVARFARLFPLYAACVLFDVWWRYLYGQLPDEYAESLIFYALITQSWFYNVFGEHSLIFQFGVMPQVSWSISTEWFFYTAYPFICFGLMRLKRLRNLLIAGVILIAVSLGSLVTLSFYLFEINRMAILHFGQVADAVTHPYDSFLFWLLYFSPYSRITEFLLGALTAAVFMKVRERPATRREQAFGAAGVYGTIAALGLSFWMIHTYEFVLDNGPQPSFLSLLKMNFGFAPFLALLVFCVARYQNSLVAFLSLPKVVICGEASYSLYMLHLEVIYAFRWTVSPVNSINVGVANGMRWGLLLLTAIGLSIVVWQVLEVPARRWLRQMLSVSEISPKRYSRRLGGTPRL